MEAENLFKNISVSVGNGTFVAIATGFDIPGGQKDDPICAIFYDAGAEDENGEVTEPPKYLIYTDSAIAAVLRHGEGNPERRRILVHEVQADLVWLASREMDVAEADKQITDLLGMPLAQAARAKQQQQQHAAVQQPQPA